MRSWTKKPSLSLVLLCLGAVFGPPLVAAIATIISVNTPPNPWEVRTEAQTLINAYQEEEENKFGLSKMMPPPDGAECGYEPSELFPGGGLLENYEKQEFTYYWGYFVVDRWRTDFEREAFNSAIAEQLDGSIDKFQLGFLRRCITTTLARDICMTRVEELIHLAGAKVDRRPPREGSIHYGTTNDVVCLYVDGVAARTGLPLQSKEED